ncbi:hypothetical protein DAPPUDRAFT_244965 [Daphnia pulex]|uniref:Ionotropic glutamate receptor C-terminal domain-containing protein n=1 Tax=Daphnia pulex TaxID=6669 RepID=E9GMA2_DAPPU|nr:hypothetical protein DAPPUDRAFT_244965 [Daphnia pulex]|eukprot:EFX79424.1 hypothetical protein DAPPUDRAFT_244965 [Daphnia pulex]
MKIQMLFLHLNGLLVNSHQHLLKFGMLERPPHFMARNTTDTNNQTFKGSWVDAIEWLSRRLNFSYNLIQSKEAWAETSGRLQRGEFDVVGPPVLMMLGRIQFFDYVGVFEEENSAMAIPALTEESTILSTIKPFEPITRSLNIGDYILYATAILTNQGSVFWQPNHQSRISFRLTAGVWCLFALVMVNVYSSTLTAHITARKTSIPPVDPIEVMEQGVLAYLAVADGFGRELILSATTGPLKKMGDIFRRHPENFVPDQETAFRKVASGCCAYNDVLERNT